MVFAMYSHAGHHILWSQGHLEPAALRCRMPAHNHSCSLMLQCLADRSRNLITVDDNLHVSLSVNVFFVGCKPMPTRLTGPATPNRLALLDRAGVNHFCFTVALLAIH